MKTRRPMLLKAVTAILACVVCSATRQAHAQFVPWLPAEGTTDLGLSQTYQTFEDFWLNTDRTHAPFGRVSQHTTTLSVEHGFTERLSAGGTLGFTRTVTTQDDLEEEGGLDDTYLGLRYNLLREEEALPAVSLRADAIIEGTYDSGFVSSPGDGASGFQTMIGVGKFLGDSGWGTFGSLGFRDRSEGVPEEMLYHASVFKRLGEHFVLSGGFRLQQGLSGYDLDDPEFTPDRFPQLRERRGTAEVALGYSDDESQRYYGIFYANTVEGRNTGDYDIVGITIAFGL